ncbi:acetyl/propionyl/methylcrotonyl-CoA carboxylase subunit alpha [Sansalvadorimonas sp. 2012CJ34-2]|uniref:Acetyl/propionyl/methylcrotonyl-CoA carboxylase subunit alpha n=1 Tax=Parendozoicomonas callyspongiae TaxID=2942213 RepID=A0ABT0PJ34_9GAMM|nr:acetyl/propionyl/methylcrotonyl-CoA carboxylase subunit alpha [Sansalvadorimonas sp. 2012CJ34-2]MCL6271390.1 acetyl/propionyl/methylcrotonyl-CoA carboxylase subunit alpha [Sansalvadorimonas sp. 2012CJ34-2]
MTISNYFSKVLIANRGEIACRVIRTAGEMGYRTVAVYSEADAGAPHVNMADQAVCIGPAPVGESYLCIEKIIDAARRTGADAVHPGYGFLSENPDFAAACKEAGITLVGPPVSAIALMGSKRQSKIAMEQAGVPCIPGYQGDAQDDETLIKEAARIGFPLMIKASAGGGGRGMRLVFDDSNLAEQMKSARSEATSAFGSGELILERALMEPRHVEIQVFADTHGKVVYLGERDCSIQRRHQKVVEEAPSPAVNSELRKQMGEAAVLAARTCDYVGAGTVEFLLDKDGSFYFLEMNTRLQVEHPVTELITGTDLVAWQLDIAAGKPLPMTQDEIQLTGHAMEVRLYAEDPAQNFMPQTGLIQQWAPAHGHGVRIDDGIQTGQVVTSHYDPMLAKIITWGEDREEARRKLIKAVEDTTLLGMHSNKAWLAAILQHSTFANGEATTAFIEQHGEEQSLQPKEPDLALSGLAALLLRDRNTRTSAWRSTGGNRFESKVSTSDSSQLLTLTSSAEDEWQVIEGEGTAQIAIHQRDNNSCLCSLNGIRQTVRFSCSGNDLWLDTGDSCHVFQDHTLSPARASEGAGSGEIRASMDGLIVDVLVSKGENVTRGQTILVLEAMKMEHPLKAGCDGVLRDISVASGEQVKGRQLLATVSSEEAA